MKQRIKVWDFPTRAFHWLLVIGFALNLGMDEDSKWHVYVGYGILALVAFRVIWGFVGSKYARFTAFPPSVMDAIEHFSEMRDGQTHVAHLSHNPLGALMVYNLLLSIALIGLTGYMMTTLAFFGIAWVGELHEVLVNWAIFSVILHVVGVIYESRRTKENLVMSMISGYKTRKYKLRKLE